MLSAIAASELLDGIRGQAGVDRAALADILLRVSQLMSDHPEIVELDLNPIMAGPQGTPSLVVDARIKIEKN